MVMRIDEMLANIRSFWSSKTSPCQNHIKWNEDSGESKNIELLFIIIISYYLLLLLVIIYYYYHKLLFITIITSYYYYYYYY